MQFDRVRRQPNARPPTGELATASQRNFRIAESADPSEYLEIDKLALMRYKYVLRKCKGQRCPKRSAITRSAMASRPRVGPFRRANPAARPLRPPRTAS